ncbi:MAG: hypothetical protein IPM40_13625 [Gammaproteobacteria bacterium]|nr:hypothetical protein [Gammaproteobacteria bacterium]
MFYRLTDSLNRSLFAIQCRRVFGSPPAKTHANSALAVITQLQHKDVLLAALALKSFAKQVPVGAFYVLDDGTLTHGDHALLKQHFPGVTFLGLGDVGSRHCPRGGTWERLLSIAELVKDRYVIQLDSDTLTLAPIPEVLSAVHSNTSFAIGTWDNQRLESMRSRQEHASRILHSSDAPAHIQVLAEANFDKLRRFNELNYIRGAPVFPASARTLSTRSLSKISLQGMFAALGDRWREWGSEQVMSNIVVANCAEAVVLPHPKYCDCTKINPGETAFIHFIGTCRFCNNTYAKHARKFLDMEIAGR